MKLDLNRFRGDADRLDRTYQPAAFAPEDDSFRLTGPVSLVAEVHKDGSRVKLTGRLTAPLECDCGRCLDPFPVPVAATFALLYVPSTEAVEVKDRQVGHGDAAVSYYQDDVIDLGELMREQFLLALPMKPLCREDCRGLCPVCGANWNRDTCTCDATWTDPRMDALRRLRENQ